MQVLYKTRILLYFLILFSLTSYVFGELDECPSGGVINQDDVPCLILLPYTSDCASLDVSFYNGSTILNTIKMFNYSPIECNATFNYTDIGTYTGNYSTGDSFSLIVEEGNNMILLYYLVLAFIIGLLILSIWQQDTTLASISAILMMVMGVYIGAQGFATLNNMVTNGLAIALIGIGAYVMLKVNIEALG